MKKLLQKLNRWFELNLSWFFVNGRKQEEHSEKLKEKYGSENYINGSTEYYKSYYEQMKQREE